MRIVLAVVAVVALATGCETSDPCATLPPPSAQELAIAEDGAQVERELDDDVECDLVNGRWLRESESDY